MAGAGAAPGQRSTELSTPSPLPLEPTLTPVWEESGLWSKRPAWQAQDSDTSARAPSKAWGHLPPLSVGNPMPTIWFWKVHEFWSQCSGWKSKILLPQIDGLGEVTVF